MTNKITFTYENDDGEEIETSLPAVYKVCDGCHGSGSHVDRNIDGNGITGSEWLEWEMDEKDAYLHGVYDVSCKDCGGLRVVLKVDEDHLTEEQKELCEIYWKKLQLDNDIDEERAMERRYGC